MTGRAWRWEIPEHLRLRVSLNMLEFLGSVVGPWLDFLLGDLPPLSCILSQTDSTTAAGWLNGTNFSDDEQYHLEAARKYAELMIQAQSVLASQWIPGILNDIADALSRDFHLTNDQILSLFLEFVPEQMPPNLQICQLPPTICSWLTSFLEARPPTTESPKIPHEASSRLAPLAGLPPEHRPRSRPLPRRIPAQPKARPPQRLRSCIPRGSLFRSEL